MGKNVMRLFPRLAALLLVTWAGPASADWHEATSKHFHVYAEESPADLKAFATRLETFDAAVREARGTPDVDAGASTQVTVYALRDIRAVRELYGDPDSGVAGFYEPRASGSVAFVPRYGETGTYELGADSIFFHEYTHHLMFEDTDRPLPTWLTEGFAEFFANPMFNKDGSVTIGAPPKYRAEVLYDQGMGGLPLNKMLSGDYTYLTDLEFESLYGRGWLLTHLLSFDLKRRGQLTRYLDEIAKGTTPLKAAQTAFGDLKQLDQQLYAYFKTDKFTVATIAASKLHLPPIEIRPLSPAMSELMNVQIKFARESKRFSPGSLEGRARSVVSRYPDDARAATLLAQIEDAAKDYDHALVHADAALKLDPRSEDAMLAKGIASMNLAKANPKSADWNQVRSYFTAANRLDVESAEPLILFYRSFVAEGAAPTENALEGLKYALALAPQDSKLRLDAVGEFLKDGRFSDAREALVPLAYSPHTGKAHDAVRAILDRVDAKDKAPALAAWETAEKFYDDGD
jgi:tetratricopeptide (TPR) repeat protein